MIAAVVTSVAVLGVARLLPAEGFGLWLRLAAATFLAFVPGMLLARALGLSGVAAAVVWSLVEIGVALVFVLALHTTLAPGLWLLAGFSVAVLPFTIRNRRRPAGWRARDPRVLVLVVGLMLGFALWSVAGVPWGDALFHIGRVRKLLDFNSLSLHRVDEFRNGGLHPGYAFPLWHGLLAVIARLAGADPAAVVLHEPSVLTPIAALIAYEAGVAVFRSRFLAVALAFASLVPLGFAGGHGGSLAGLAQPGSAAKQVLVPASILVFFRFLEGPTPSLLASLTAANGVLALIHPTYALFLLLELAGFAAACALVRRPDLGRALAALPAAAVAVGAALLWLRPIARQAFAHNPSPAERARGLLRYHDELVVSSAHRYALSPELFARTGAVAVAALVLLPLAGLAARRRWSTFVLGASLPLFTVLLLKPVFPHFADLVSLSQARRAAGFIPLPYAFVGGAAILSALTGRLLLVLGLGAGVALQRVFPGDFSSTFTSGAPALPVWIAFVGAAVALAIASAHPRLPRLKPRLLPATGATALFLVPVVVHGLSHWTPFVEHDKYALTRGLVSALDERISPGGVVFSDLETSYRISAYTPLYVAAAPPAHVANTKANHPSRRRRDVLAFYRSGNLSIPRRYHARWLVIDRSRFRIRPALPVLYRDHRFTLYTLPARR